MPAGAYGGGLRRRQRRRAPSSLSSQSVAVGCWRVRARVSRVRPGVLRCPRGCRCGWACRRACGWCSRMSRPAQCAKRKRQKERTQGATTPGDRRRASFAQIPGRVRRLTSPCRLVRLSVVRVGWLTGRRLQPACCRQRQSSRRRVADHPPPDRSLAPLSGPPARRSSSLVRRRGFVSALSAATSSGVERWPVDAAAAPRAGRRPSPPRVLRSVGQPAAAAAVLPPPPPP